MEYSISIGYLWRNKNININELTHKADEYMYQAKRTYYDYIEKSNIEIFSAMATETEDDFDKIRITLGYDTELDFSTDNFTLKSKQDIFNFKVKN